MAIHNGLTNVSIKTDGYKASIHLNGEFISQFVTGYRIEQGQPGDIPRLELTIIAADGLEYEGPAIVACSVKCPVCEKVIRCDHEGETPRDGFIETTGMDTEFRSYVPNDPDSAQ